MGVAVKEIGIKLVKILIAYTIAEITWKGIKNKMHGKTVFGNKMKPREKTYVNWQGHVILGNEDGWVS